MKIRSFLTEMSKAVGTKHRTLILGSAIAQCESEILSNIGILRRGIANEAELRFAVADPILKLFCSFWNGGGAICCCRLPIVVGETGGDCKTPLQSRGPVYTAVYTDEDEGNVTTTHSWS